MKPMCFQCGKKPVRPGSRFCTHRCAANWLSVRYPNMYAAIPARTVKYMAEELAMNGSEWCSSCRAWVFPDESRHLSHPYDSPTVPFDNVAEY